MTRDADEGFFSRWSRRKAEVREQQKPATPPTSRIAHDEPATPVEAVQTFSSGVGDGASHHVAELGTPAHNGGGEQPKPTLQETESLTPESDFSRFVKKDVSSDVRNAAVKKLFADPHFNVMDGLDIYIDDYTQTEPIPAAMMAKMVGAQFLKLVDDPADIARKERSVDAESLQSDARTETAESTQASGVGEPEPIRQGASEHQSKTENENKDEASAPDAGQPTAKPYELQESHDDPDLHLQPNHSTGRQGTG